ncbi:MAG: glutamate-cysteine ligase family protein [Candidatus Bathyarchaeia archaeon]|jgi:gamma-glutamyl:cysteine ligase YbdK (ATP-grasp superfamily)
MKFTYKPLEVLGPEHEYSIVNQNLQALPISDKIIKQYCGKIVNFIELPKFTFGKELQLHVMEIKANTPFHSPLDFEETMQNAVSTLNRILHRHGACLLGTGMHPLLNLEETSIWPHYHRKIYQEYAKIFNLKQHGWLNIQSFHLNLPFQTEADAVKMHNHLANMCAYLPAVAASSPIFEGKEGTNVDNRLSFYRVNQREVPSVTGGVIPEYITSLKQYKHDVIEQYSNDLAAVGASKILLHREWVNSRGVIFRFDRSALEVRVMDEQECVKSDVALACFVRAALRGLLDSDAELLPREVLLNDFDVVIHEGLNAKVSNGQTARQVCQGYLRLAEKYADSEEQKYLWLIKRRIEEGSLSEVIRKNVRFEAEKAGFHQAIQTVYSRLINCLSTNEPYF